MKAVYKLLGSKYLHVENTFGLVVACGATKYIVKGSNPDEHFYFANYSSRFRQIPPDPSADAGVASSILILLRLSVAG